MLDFALLKTLSDCENLTLTDEMLEKLDIYAKLLVETNQKFNLTAITEPKEMTIKHFADCLAIFKYVDFKKNAKLIDVGTGAGFPGLVLKLVRPDLDVTFLDGTKKKLGFIDAVLAAVDLQGETLHARAEEAGKNSQYRGQYDYATARAVSNLPMLLEYALPFLKTKGQFISMKSATVGEELDEAKKAISILGGKVTQNILFDLVEEMPRRVILIKKISQTPAKYPRPSAKIAKNPLK